MKLNIGWIDWKPKRQPELLAFHKGIERMIDDRKGSLSYWYFVKELLE